MPTIAPCSDAAARSPSLRQVASQYLTVARDRELTRYRLITDQVLDRFVAGLHQPVASAGIRLILTAGRDQAAHVRDLLVSSGRWVEVAAANSIDPLGRVAGGEQPLLNRKDHADPALLSAVFRLPLGVLSAPVHLRQGWAIIQVLHVYPAADIYSADQLRYKLWIAGLRRRARITSYIRLAPKQP